MMKVRDLMATDVACAGAYANAGALAETLWTRDCAFLPIVDDARRVVGVVTDRDMAIGLGTRGGRACELTASDLMSRPVAVCRQDDDVQQALATMQSSHVRRLVVLDAEDALVGVVSLTDIARKAAPRDVSFERLVKTLGVLRQPRAAQPTAITARPVAALAKV